MVVPLMRKRITVAGMPAISVHMFGRLSQELDGKRPPIDFAPPRYPFEGSRYLPEIDTLHNDGTFGLVDEIMCALVPPCTEEDGTIRPNGFPKLFWPSAKQSNALLVPSQDPRWSRVGDTSIYRGLQVDAVEIHEQRSAVIITVADCWVVTFINTHTQEVVVAHASLRSLVDMQEAWTGNRSRNDRSVVDVVLRPWLASGTPANKIKVYATAGIRPQYYPYDPNHSEHSANNARLHEFLLRQHFTDGRWAGQGLVNIPGIITAQCLQHRVIDVTIDFPQEGTSQKDPVTGEYLYYSRVRGDKGSNAVLVVME
jgi:copper oxidase (laccase) domain-containing protein